MIDFDKFSIFSVMGKEAGKQTEQDGSDADETAPGHDVGAADDVASDSVALQHCGLDVRRGVLGAGADGDDAGVSGAVSDDRRGRRHGRWSQCPALPQDRAEAGG